MIIILEIRRKKRKKPRDITLNFSVVNPLSNFRAFIIVYLKKCYPLDTEKKKPPDSFENRLVPRQENGQAIRRCCLTKIKSILTAKKNRC